MNPTPVKWVTAKYSYLCMLKCFRKKTITLKKLNSLTSIEMFSWLNWVRDFPGSIPGSGKDFYVCCFVLLLLCCTLCSKHIICHELYNSFCSVNSFSILNILKIIWPIIRVSRYSYLASLTTILISNETWMNEFNLFLSILNLYEET